MNAIQRQTQWPFDLTLDQEQYVRHVLERYRQTPTVQAHIRRADRELAGKLYRRAVPLGLVEAAFSLAAVRRIFRHHEMPVLQPIRSLHYFVPVLKELLQDPPDPGYIQCLDFKLANLDFYGLKR